MLPDAALQRAPPRSATKSPRRRTGIRIAIIPGRERGLLTSTRPWNALIRCRKLSVGRPTIPHREAGARAPAAEICPPLRPKTTL